MGINAGEKYAVTVQKILPIGAIVTIGSDPETYLIHVSNIANAFVKDVADFVTVGQTYMADAVIGKVKPVELSLKSLDLKAVSDYIATPQPPKDPPKIPEFGPYQPQKKSATVYPESEPINKDPYGLGRPARRPQNKKPYGAKNKNQKNRRYDY